MLLVFSEIAACEMRRWKEIQDRRYLGAIYVWSCTLLGVVVVAEYMYVIIR